MTSENTAVWQPQDTNDGPDLPQTPATAANLTGWAYYALWLTPFADIHQARPDEPDCLRMVAAQATATEVTIVLENGQVFTLTPAELTRPTGDPARPFTLNPAARASVHASLDGAPLCGRGAEGEAATPDWHEVTCLDCQLAAPETSLATLSAADLVLTAKEIRDILTAERGPLTTYDIMLRAEPRDRAAVPGCLDTLAGQGSVVKQAGSPDGGSPEWRLAGD